MTTLAPLADSPDTETDLETGTTTTQLSSDTRDTAHRLPSVLALAKSLGGAYAENANGLNPADALRAAGLDFIVEKYGPLTVPMPGGGTLTGLDHLTTTVAQYADDRPARMLGVVGTGYEIVQPMQAAEYGQQILDESGATVVCACAYGRPEGSRMVLGLKLPEGLKVAGEDPHDLYLFVGNSWNLSTGLWGCVAPIRLACTNQAAVTFGRLSNRFSIRHTVSLAGQVEQAQLALRITQTFTERYGSFAERLLRTPMGHREVVDFVEALMPTPKTVKGERGNDNWELRRHELRMLITEADTNAFGRGTRYAAYQGVVEHADWYRAARSPVSRYTRIVDGGEPERLKTHAATLLLAGL